MVASHESLKELEGRGQGSGAGNMSGQQGGGRCQLNKRIRFDACLESVGISLCFA
jgi:hypothetical protein